MKQEERDKILSEELWFTSNIPISMWKSDGSKFHHPIIAMPRKEACFCGDDFESKEEFEKYCDMAIAAYENAVDLFKLLKEGKIDHIYYFDSPEKYLSKMKENQN